MSEDKFGAINVEMGDNNSVGHIGHKITFHQPPPDPNSLWQHGRIVGSLGSAPTEAPGGKVQFDKLFLDAGFNMSSHFEAQGVKLRIEGYGNLSSVSLAGRPAQTTLWQVICQQV